VLTCKWCRVWTHVTFTRITSGSLIGETNAMSERVMPSSTFDVTLVRASSTPADAACVPTGYCLSETRLRHLAESELILISEGGRLTGLAAYKPTDGELRVVHELLVDRSLAPAKARRVTEILLSSLELTAYEDGVQCLTFLLRDAVAVEPFEQRGYMSMSLGSSGIWLQRKLGWFGWRGRRSERPS